MHSISDLTTFARKTKGHVPPQLVGASTTVVGNKLYLFGGRLVSLRRMVSDLYVFDLETFVWEKLDAPPDPSDVPGARYFHSADSYNDYLVIFGGMGYVAPDSEDLCVLNDVRLFDLRTRSWLPATPDATLPPDTPSLVPRARYAHLSSITSDRLFIIGGQDMTNVWLDDIHVFDLQRLAWVQRQEYPRHCGTYRSVAVSGKQRVRLPMEERRGEDMGLLGPPGSRFRVDGVPPPDPNRVISDEVVHLPYSTTPTPEYPCDIMLYSNYNFTDVRRELEVITPQEPSSFTITDRSDAMSGLSLPPGLRFPTGAILGSHLIIAGTYLAHSYQSFSIWALDLHAMTWTRIDAGTTLTTGSWSRGVLWPTQNKFLIFGNRAGNLVEDYNRRLLSWDHVAYIDLEAFGIYQPPRLMLMDLRTQELGLAALEERVLVDFEVVCEDGRRIPCSRRTLEERWGWFKEQRRRYLRDARRALEELPGAGVGGDVPLPESTQPAAQKSAEGEDDEKPDPRLMPRSLHLSEPYSTTLALLQYIYALGLVTPLQHSPAILSALLLLSTTYKMPHLESLVKHAMHRNLSPSSSVGVYEVATLCDCQSLQIRALKVVMSSSRRPTQPSRSGASGPGGPDPQGPPPSSSNGPGGKDKSNGAPGQARPRGLSDANRLGNVANGAGARDNVGAEGGVSRGTARRPSTADPPASAPMVRAPRSQLSVDTTFLVGGSKTFNAEEPLTTTTTTTTTTARSAISGSGSGLGMLDGVAGEREMAVGPVPVSAVVPPTTNPLFVVSPSPDTQHDNAVASRSTQQDNGRGFQQDTAAANRNDTVAASRTDTATASRSRAAPPLPPPTLPVPVPSGGDSAPVSDTEAQLQRAIRIEKRRMSRKAALAAHKVGGKAVGGGGAVVDAYPTTEDEMAAMNGDEEDEDASDEGEDDDGLHSAFPVPPPMSIPFAAQMQQYQNQNQSLQDAAKRSLSPGSNRIQRSPPSSFVMPGGGVHPGPSPWSVGGMRRKASDVSTSTSSSSRISGASSITSQSVVAGRRRAGSDSTDGPLTPPATMGLPGTLSVGIVGGAFAVVNTANDVGASRLLDRIDESAAATDAKRLPPHLNVPPEPPKVSVPDARRPSAASSDGGFGVGGGQQYIQASSSSHLASPHPNPRDVHPDSELDVPGPRTGHRQTGSISGGSGGARSVATAEIPLQRNLTGTSSGDSMGSVVGLPYTSPMSPIPNSNTSKIDKQVEKARKNLEKLEKKARERAEKEEKMAAERAEKTRKKIAAQSAQEMFDRGRYMGVLGFR